MKKIKIDSEHRALIESVIRENPKFRNNEELLELFCEAIYKKSYLLIDAIRDKARLKRHLMMISDSCMDQIIKEKKKFEQTKIYRQIEHTSNLQKEIIPLKNSPLTQKEELEEEFRMQQASRRSLNVIK